MFPRPYPLTAAEPGTNLANRLLTCLSLLQRQWKDIKPRYLVAAEEEDDE